MDEPTQPKKNPPAPGKALEQATADAAKALKPEKTVALTAAEAAKAVKRLVPVLGEDGKPTGKTKEVALREEEVHAWALRGQRVIVVTVDGQKLEGSL